MKLVHHIDSARELLEKARRQCDATPLGEHSRNLRDTIGKVDNELHELRSLCDDVEARLAVLEIIASEKDPEEALVASLGYLTDRLGVDASGLRLREGDDFPYFTTVGFSKEFVLAESSLCQRDHSGPPVRDQLGNVVLECMCRNVIRRRCDPSPAAAASGPTARRASSKRQPTTISWAGHGTDATARATNRLR